MLKFKRQTDPLMLSGMRAAGALAAEVLDMITDHVAPGITTGELDRLCHDYIINAGARSASLGYRGFPKSTCISVNHVVCHGIPTDDKVLNDGDIANIDVTVIVDGWHGDSSRMYYIGQPRQLAQRLVQVTYEAMMAGIATISAGSTLGDLGHAIQSHVEQQGYAIVTTYCGHGIGRQFHMAPNVLHYGSPGSGAKLKAGMFLTVEPMVNIGTSEVKTLADGWTVVTRDRKLSAQFEHTVAVLESGVEILTLSPKGYTAPPYHRN